MSGNLAEFPDNLKGMRNRPRLHKIVLTLWIRTVRAKLALVNAGDRGLRSCCPVYLGHIHVLKNESRRMGTVVMAEWAPVLTLQHRRTSVQDPHFAVQGRRHTTTSRHLDWGELVQRVQSGPLIMVPRAVSG